MDEDQEEDTQVLDEPYYLQLWEIERRMKDGSRFDEHAEKAYRDLQKLHQKQLDKYGEENLTPQEAFSYVLKQRKGLRHQRRMGHGVIPFINSQVQEVNEDEI